MWKGLMILLPALAAAGCATHAVTSGQVTVRDDRATVQLRFTAGDRTLITEHYQRAGKAKKAPPGLAKREQLPPGLARGGKLPPGLQGRLLPRELESRLSVLPAPYVRVIVGADVVLMNRDTRVVLDIVPGVVLP